MYLKRFEETEIIYAEGAEIKAGGNLYHVLVPAGVANILTASLVTLEKGRKTPAHVHDDQEQLFFILQGRGVLRINEEAREVESQMVAYIPRRAEHELECTSDEPLLYIFVSGHYPAAG